MPYQLKISGQPFHTEDAAEDERLNRACAAVLSYEVQGQRDVNADMPAEDRPTWEVTYGPDVPEWTEEDMEWYNLPPGCKVIAYGEDDCAMHFSYTWFVTPDDRLINTEFGEVGHVALVLIHGHRVGLT